MPDSPTPRSTDQTVKAGQVWKRTRGPSIMREAKPFRIVRVNEKSATVEYPNGWRTRIALFAFTDCDTYRLVEGPS